MFNAEHRPRAIIQCADQGPLESLVIMLQSVGWECLLPSEKLKHELRRIGCDTVLDIDSLMKGMGYERPFMIPEADLSDMNTPSTIYVDVKAHRSYPKIISRWPNLLNRVLWSRINGGRPEHVIKLSGEDCGDETHPPCPILTPNRWYTERYLICDRCYGSGESPPDEMCWECQGSGKKEWKLPRYAVWPPFHRFDDYYTKHGRINAEVSGPYANPICLTHNLQGWGYQSLIPNIQALGVRFFGRGSPDGLVNHRYVPDLLRSTLALVHLKSSDAPGYSLYEALAAGCPIICSRRLIWRNKMQDLFTPGITCLVFDRETHEGLSPKDVEDCTREITQHLQTLRDPKVNQAIGMAGRKRLQEIMWTEKDKPSLARFLAEQFPGC